MIKISIFIIIISYNISNNNYISTSIKKKYINTLMGITIYFFGRTINLINLIIITNII